MIASDIIQSFVIEIGDPACIIKQLSNHLSRGATSLEFEDNAGTLTVECQKVYPAAEFCLNLTSDQNQFEAEDRGILVEPCLKPLLLVQG